jgi:hypothetical protein
MSNKFILFLYISNKVIKEQLLRQDNSYRKFTSNIMKKYNFSLIHAHPSSGGRKSQETKLLIIVVL